MPNNYHTIFSWDIQLLFFPQEQRKGSFITHTIYYIYRHGGLMDCLVHQSRNYELLQIMLEYWWFLSEKSDQNCFDKYPFWHCQMASSIYIAVTAHSLGLIGLVSAFDFLHLAFSLLASWFMVDYVMKLEQIYINYSFS